MNTLTDLRRTLDLHAADVADPASVARTTAVHHRIAAVRRRRRSVAVGAVALAVVAGVSVATWTRASDDALPAAPVVLGQQAPTTIDSLGYTYRTDGHGESFGRSGSISVSTSSRPLLVSWTTDGAGAVRLTLPDRSVVHSSVSDFEDFVVIPPGVDGDLEVSVDRGRVGLASYDVTGTAPPGYTSAGLTYRSSVAGTSLLTARIAERGQAVLHASYVAPGGWVSVHEMCSGLPKHAVVNVSLNGRGRVSGTSCDSAGTFDPGAGGDASFPVDQPGELVHVRMWVSAGYRDATPLPASAVPDLRLGVGVYGPLHQQRVGGYTVPTSLERGGHTYRLVSWRNSSGAPIDLPAADVDRLATMAWHTHGSTRISFGADSATPEGGNFGGGRAALPGVWIAAGSPVHASLDRGTGTFGVAVYERVG
jgi:hypothetical protein